MRCKACNTAWMVTGPAKLPTPVEPLDLAAPRAAIVRTGSEREKRDLFAARETDDVSAVKEHFLPPPSTGYGARNENSVLFSLDQFAKSSTTAPPSVAPSAQSASPGSPPQVTLNMRVSTSDDSGVIDLNALSARPRTAPVAPVAPLFSDPPPAVAMDINSTKSHPIASTFTKGQIIGGIAAAAALVLVATLGIALTFRGEEPVKRSAATVVVATPPPPPAVVAPPAQPDPAPATTAASSSDDSSDAKPAKGKGKGHGRGRAAKSTSSPPSTGFTAPKPVKAADPCHCKGDFNCILACTAKGGK